MFRAQLLLEEQRRLYDVWSGAACGMAMPTRESFQPKAFGPLLPFISLIETKADEEPRVRVAGSALREVFGEDPRVCLANDDVMGAMETIKRVVAEARPLCGVAPAQLDHQGHLVRFWMRLPLGHGDEVVAVIGLDIALSGARVPGWALQSVLSA
ncbi:PAS domain-containing protein [Candidatus Phycosocius spiralis]|uniref:PAS domain-containing protein n=1 Tax=Candidatus Phycosocius spiralis TaxID=2815099 RepID=A0ABQ4PTP0_9PROT|nr:PAS domain-containing protein [Candidatus Phycosocius spiralis]GIU66346.1 PAS domain-containing protein [Candidatus Phycosocius spiralis]